MAAAAFDHPTVPLFAPGAPSPMARGMGAFGSTVAAWETRARTRAALRALPADRLADLGLSPTEALHEARKPFWRT